MMIEPDKNCDQWSFLPADTVVEIPLTVREWRMIVGACWIADSQIDLNKARAAGITLDTDTWRMIADWMRDNLAGVINLSVKEDEMFDLGLRVGMHVRND